MLHEECGVFGVFSPKAANLAELTYYVLFALQHRGQESAGIAVDDDGVITAVRDLGLVSEVFTQDRLESAGCGDGACSPVIPCRSRPIAARDPRG